MKKLKENKTFIALGKFYNTHTIGKLTLTIFLVAVVLYILFMIPVWGIKEGTVPETVSSLSETGGEIKKGQGVVLLAENTGKSLYLDTDTLVFEVKDEEQGTIFSSAALGGTDGSEQALLSVNYLGKDNNLYEWNSYDNCVALESYTIHEIEGGARISLNLNEGESKRFYEYLPKKMSIDRYKQLFDQGLNQAVEDGAVEAERAEKLRRTLSLVYKKSIMEECYAVTYTGTPPVNAVSQMIELAKLVGYTREMLLEDAEEFDFTVTFTEAPEFDIVLELSLEEGALKAHLPSGAMVSHNEYYTIQNIELLPNFGAADSASYEDGSILIPDGAGALMAFNSYQANVKEYERPLYDNDYYKDYWFMPEYAQELYMPIYGMLYGVQEQTEKGFLAIVEQGSRNAYIHAKLASEGGDSSKYNKIFASFDTDQYSKVKINGPYSENSANYLVDTGMQDLDCSVVYHFFGQGVTYFDLAKDYQQYLAASEGMDIEYADGKAKLYLEAVGALSIEQRLAGIPYHAVYSMTEYSQLQEIMTDLSEMEYILQYDGVFNQGMNNRISTEAELVKENGSESQWQQLQKYAETQDVELYMNVALSQVGEKGNGFMASRHGVRDFANDELIRFRYMPVLGIRYGDLYNTAAGEGFYTIAPKYLSSVVDAFLENAEEYPYLAVEDLANMYYADYRFQNIVTGEQGNLVLEEELAKLSEKKQLALENPHMDKLGYGAVAVDISRESSDYVTFATTIPFKQLVMNGLISYTTEDVNLSSKSPAYYILQSAELGAYPKLTISYQPADAIKDSEYSYLYSTEYKSWKDTIKNIYEECSQLRRQIGTEEIIGHRSLGEGIYETTYANGTRVIVNYNLYAVTLSDGEILAAEGYSIKEGQ